MALTGEVLAAIPHATGVYLFRDGKDQVVYVGKASDLKKRLTSYFYRRNQGPKVEAMLSNLTAVETILTDNEKEALILESNLIKKYRPRYNVILRDDKTYLSLRLDLHQKFPRISMVRRLSNDGATYFGPFVSAASVRDTLRFLHKLFPLRRCRDSTFKSRTRPCLNHQIKRCLAPCVGLVSEEEYRKLVEQVVFFFQGRLPDLQKVLQKEMRVLAKRMEYEKAALCHDRQLAIERTLERQSVTSARLADQDAIGLYRKDKDLQISILFVRNRAVIGHRSFPFQSVQATNAEALSDFLKQFYSENKYIPSEVLLPLAIEDQALISSWLRERTGRKTSILVPRRGDKYRVLMLAMKNAESSFCQKIKGEEDTYKLLALLQEKLRLRHYPAHIEGFDISNIGGKMAVGSLVAFVGGSAKRDLYRSYRIRLPEQPDDYGMMRELLARRLQRAKEEAFWPNLLLIDGGRGHLKIAEQVLEDLHRSDRVDLIALAKGEKGEADKVYLPGRKNPVVWKGNSPLLLYLQSIRDEAHRFAIAHHRKLRQKDLTRSLLDAIPGVGITLKKRLLAHFGSISKLKGASVAEIMSVKGIHASLAVNIKTFLAAYQSVNAGRNPE